jgi:hypothetical protein
MKLRSGKKIGSGAKVVLDSRLNVIVDNKPCVILDNRPNIIVDRMVNSHVPYLSKCVSGIEKIFKIEDRIIELYETYTYIYIWLADFEFFHKNPLEKCNNVTFKSVIGLYSTIINKIPDLIEQCLNNCNNGTNILFINSVKNEFELIKLLCKIQKLYNSFNLK